MNTRYQILLVAAVLGSVLLASPLYAHSWQISVAGAAAAEAQYPDRQYSHRWGHGTGYDNYAYSNGYSDGYENGWNDAIRRKACDPRRERWYRDGDRGYNRRFFMPRDQYRDFYRSGFLAGYEAGRRDAERSTHGYGRPGPYPYPRSRRPGGGIWFFWKF
jgi:hypothetical protein